MAGTWRDSASHAGQWEGHRDLAQWRCLVGRDGDQAARGEMGSAAACTAQAADDARGGTTLAWLILPELAVFR